MLYRQKSTARSTASWITVRRVAAWSVSGGWLLFSPRLWSRFCLQRESRTSSRDQDRKGRRRQRQEPYRDVPPTQATTQRKLSNLACIEEMPPSVSIKEKLTSIAIMSTRLPESQRSHRFQGYSCMNEPQKVGWGPCCLFGSVVEGL